MFQFVFFIFILTADCYLRCTNHLSGCGAYCPDYVDCRHSSYMVPCQTVSLSLAIAKLKYEIALFATFLVLLID